MFFELKGQNYLLSPQRTFGAHRKNRQALISNLIFSATNDNINEHCHETLQPFLQYMTPHTTRWFSNLEIEYNHEKGIFRGFLHAYWTLDRAHLQGHTLPSFSWSISHLLSHNVSLWLLFQFLWWLFCTSLQIQSLILRWCWKWWLTRWWWPLLVNRRQNRR